MHSVGVAALDLVLIVGDSTRCLLLGALADKQRCWLGVLHPLQSCLLIEASLTQCKRVFVCGVVHPVQWLSAGGCIVTDALVCWGQGPGFSSSKSFGEQDTHPSHAFAGYVSSQRVAAVFDTRADQNPLTLSASQAASFSQ